MGQVHSDLTNWIVIITGLTIIGVSLFVALGGYL